MLHPVSRPSVQNMCDVHDSLYASSHRLCILSSPEGALSQHVSFHNDYSLLVVSLGPRPTRMCGFKALLPRRLELLVRHVLLSPRRWCCLPSSFGVCAAFLSLPMMVVLSPVKNNAYCTTQNEEKEKAAPPRRRRGQQHHLHGCQPKEGGEGSSSTTQKGRGSDIRTTRQEGRRKHHHARGAAFPPHLACCCRFPPPFGWCCFSPLLLWHT